jgi:GAF domain-containing protein
VVVGAVALAGGAFAVHTRRLLPLYAGAYAGIVVVTLLPRVSYALQVTVILALAYGLGVLGLSQGGLSGDGRIFMLAFSCLAALFLGRRAAVVSLALSMLTMAVFGWVLSSGYLVFPEGYHISTASPVDWLSGMFVFLMVGIVMVVSQGYLVSRLTAALEGARGLARQLGTHHAALEERSRELRNANEALERRTSQLELGLQVGQVAGQGLSVDAFIARAVAAIQEQLGLDRVAAYLLSSDRSCLELQAASPELDGIALARGGRGVALDVAPVLQECVNTGQPRWLLNEDNSSERVGGGHDGVGGDGFLLAGARTALALPMIACDGVIGVIALQSTKASVLLDDDASSLLPIADQVAVAVSHALLSSELRTRLGQMESLQRYYVREAWESFTSGWHATWYEYDRPGVTTLVNRHLPEVERALADPQLAILDAAESAAQSALVVPISLRDQVIGVLGLHEVDGRIWTQEDIDIVTGVVEQMGLLLDNARLFEETRSRAGQERKVREISAQMRETLDIETVLRTAVDEIYAALGLEEVVVQLAGGNGTD